MLLYADEATDAIRNAIDETNRRREIQMAYNEEHGITPTTIDKAIHDLITKLTDKPDESETTDAVPTLADVGAEEIQALLTQLTSQMQKAAAGLEFEQAAALRDQISELKRELKEG